MSSTCIVSVVIPAHNEERDIRDTLNVLLADAEPGEFDVVVVPNACSDMTAEVARSLPDVRVLETPEAGKAGALRLGYVACSTFPRLFLDADVRLSTESVRRLVERLRIDDDVIACSPRVEWDTSGCGPVALRAHRAHDALIAPRRVLSGVGAFLLDRSACERVFPIPDVIADDEYVHRSFTETERVTVIEAVALTRPASSLRVLARRRSRVRLGNRQLETYPGRGADRAGRLGLLDLAHAVRSRDVGALDGGCLLVAIAGERLLTVISRMRRRTVAWSVDRDGRREGGTGG